MSKLVLAALLIVVIVVGLWAYLKPSARAFREYGAAAEAGYGWISERDRCRIGTKIAKALLAEKDSRYAWWDEAAQRACVEAAQVDAEALR